MLKQHFAKQGIKEAQIEEFIRSNFPLGDYSKTELQRTPLGIKIIIYTNKPGRIIGKGGKNINEITEAIKKRFDLENPQLDVKSIENPNLDAKIVAKQLVSAIERGYNYKKIGNLTLKRVLDAGAIGVEIVIAGKLGGNKGMRGKFVSGYIKHCGHPAKTLVDVGFEEAFTKPGKVGVKVRIMKQFMDVTGDVRRSKERAVKKKAAKAATEDEKKAHPEKPTPQPRKKKKSAAPQKKKSPAKKEAKKEPKKEKKARKAKK